MKFIQGVNRSQISLFPVSLDEAIDPDNEVRLIDLFVNSLNVNPENALENLFRPKTTVKSVIFAFPSLNIILPLCFVQEMPDFFVLLTLMTKF